MSERMDDLRAFKAGEKIHVRFTSGETAFSYKWKDGRLVYCYPPRGWRGVLHRLLGRRSPWWRA
jgi:hypothetical protein